MQTFWIIVSAIAFNAAALAFMFLYFKRLIRNALGLDEVLDRAREEIGGMIAEMNQTTDRNVSLIEDRIAKAQELVDIAEKRFEILSRQAGQRSREREMFERLSRAGSALQVEERQGSAAGRSGSAPSAPEKGTPSGEAPGLPVEPKGQAPLPRIEKRPESVDSGLSLPERAVRLWEQGFSAELIAPKLGMTIAEIDLIISMAEQRRLLGK